MIEVMAQFEALPEAYPSLPGPPGDELTATAWQRIEAYTAYRFAPRLVTWHVVSEGGEWVLPLRPATDVAAGIWTGDGYAPVTLAPAPGGWRIPPGRFQVTATVGAGPVPVAVATAVKRLAEYLAQGLPGGVSSLQSGALSLRFRANHEARAIQNSGAGDLLRPYRRA